MRNVSVFANIANIVSTAAYLIDFHQITCQRRRRRRLTLPNARHSNEKWHFDSTTEHRVRIHMRSQSMRTKRRGRACATIDKHENEQTAPIESLKRMC